LTLKGENKMLLWNIGKPFPYVMQYPMPEHRNDQLHHCKNLKMQFPFLLHNVGVGHTGVPYCSTVQRLCFGSLPERVGLT
jgi:hypothetical protein